MLSLVMVGFWPGPGAAQSSASFQIPRQSVDGGGGSANSASYTITGTIGQSDAGNSTAASASYTVRGGLQRAATAGSLPDGLFANGFESP